MSGVAYRCFSNGQSPEIYMCIEGSLTISLKDLLLYCGSLDFSATFNLLDCRARLVEALKAKLRDSAVVNDQCVIPSLFHEWRCMIESISCVQHKDEFRCPSFQPRMPRLLLTHPMPANQMLLSMT